MNILVIDVGTSSLRGIVFGEEGQILHSRSVRYQVDLMGNGLAEQSADDWASALVEVCRSAAANVTIGALALTCQRSSIIPVDINGKPLRRAIMWQDTRNKGLVDELAGYNGFILEKTGARLNTVFSGTKIMWLRRNEPEIYEKAHKICTVADYLVHLMTGEFVTDATYGSRSLLMDLRSRRWDGELLALFETDREKLCDIAEPGSVAGEISESFASQTGLSCGIPVISSGGDQQCAAIGNGAVSENTMTATFGTGAFIMRMVKSLPARMDDGLTYGVYSIPGSYVAEAGMLTCSSLYEWGVRTFYPEGIEKMNEEAAAVPAGANGVTVIPYFQGSGTPDWDSSARGRIDGLTLSRTRADIARAILESIVSEAAANIRLMERTGRADRICIGGGFTKQPVFAKLLSEACSRQVVVEKDFREQTARGAWIVAAASLGISADCAEAYSCAVTFNSRQEV